jgi:hypothetical protein
MTGRAPIGLAVSLFSPWPVSRPHKTWPSNGSTRDALLNLDAVRLPGRLKPLSCFVMYAVETPPMTPEGWIANLLQRHQERRWLAPDAYAWECRTNCETLWTTMCSPRSRQRVALASRFSLPDPLHTSCRQPRDRVRFARQIGDPASRVIHARITSRCRLHGAVDHSTAVPEARRWPKISQFIKGQARNVALPYAHPYALFPWPV